jgi:hypothetical protein
VFFNHTYLRLFSLAHPFMFLLRQNLPQSQGLHRPPSFDTCFILYLIPGSVHFPPSPVTASLIYALGQQHVLEKNKLSGPPLCHLCRHPLPTSCDKIRVHYSKYHCQTVGVELTYPPIPTHPSRGGNVPVATVIPPGQEASLDPDPDSVMATDSPTPPDRPLDDTRNEDHLLEPEDDFADVWDVESVYSDSSEDVVDDGQDNQVVPASFILPSSSPSLADNDSSTDSQDVDIQAVNDQDTPQKNVYCSNSKYRRTFNRSANSLLLIVSGLNYDHPLSEFGFALNVEVTAAICVSCSKGVPLDMIRSHCRGHHPGRDAPSPTRQKEITDDQSNHGLRSSSSDKYIQPAGQKPVDGLEVLQGYMCPMPDSHGITCSMAFPAKSSFLRHLSVHPIYPRPDPTSCTSSIQTLFAQGGLQAYFPVNVSLSQPDPPPNSAYVDALHLLHTLPAPQIPIPNNDKERASIHWFTRWPELLEPYCSDESKVLQFRSLVSFPHPGVDPDWLLTVQDHGSKWWVKAESAHVNCSHRASVLLKSHQEYVSALFVGLSSFTPCLGIVAPGRCCVTTTVPDDIVQPPYRLCPFVSESSTFPLNKFPLDLRTDREIYWQTIDTTLRLSLPLSTTM